MVVMSRFDSLVNFDPSWPTNSCRRVACLVAKALGIVPIFSLWRFNSSSLNCSYIARIYSLLTSDWLQIDCGKEQLVKFFLSIYAACWRCYLAKVNKILDNVFRVCQPTKLGAELAQQRWFQFWMQLINLNSVGLLDIVSQGNVMFITDIERVVQCSRIGLCKL